MADKVSKIDTENLPAFIVEQIDFEQGKIKDFISGTKVPATPEELHAVQVFARRLVEDYGYSKKQIQTRPQFHVRKSPSDETRQYPVDIAIFKATQKTEAELFMVVECKQPTKKAGLRQLEIYMDLSPAIVGVWFNGKEHAYIRKVQSLDGTIKYVPIPNIPMKGQRIEDIGLFKRKDLHATRNLKGLFKDIRNRLAQQAVGITRDEVLAQQIINLLFCKIYDELNTGPEELVTFRSGVEEGEKEVATRLCQLFSKVKNQYSDIFETTDEIRLDDNSVHYVVGELQNWCISEAERDVLGDAFEVFIGPALKGPQGQFFTPRNVVRLAVNIIDPKAGQMVIDPACGSGGFLVIVIEYVWRKLAEEAKRRRLGKRWLRDKQKDAATKCIRGIDKDSFLAKVTKAYMAIIGDGRGGIFCENSLKDPTDWKAKTRDKIKLGGFQLLFTNPPFGAQIAVSEKAILQAYDLGHKYKKRDRGRRWEKTSTVRPQQPPQILFIERCLEFLDPGGRLAIVLPDGVLGGSKLGYVPFYMFQKAKPIALIDLPTETFQPSVSTKTHLVVLEKRKEDKEDEPADYEVFLAVADSVGHDQKGRPIYRTESGRLLADDLPDIAEKYDTFRKGSLRKSAFSRQGYSVSSKWLENFLLAKRYLPTYTDARAELRRLDKTDRFQVLTLAEISAKLFTGANIEGSEYVDDSDHRYLMTDCITEAGINPAGFKHITAEAYEANLSKTIRVNDIVINRTGTPGLAAVFPEDMAGAMACGFVFVLRVKKGYDPHYVAAFLNSRLGRLQAERCSFGSILDHITKDDLEDIEIAFPTDKGLLKKIAKEFKTVVETQMQARVAFANFQKEFEKCAQILKTPSK